MFHVQMSEAQMFKRNEGACFHETAVAGFCGQSNSGIMM
jgi:hypothetical protein